MKSFLVSALAMLMSAVAMAQPAEAMETADFMRGSGKIYVVVAVICLILLVLLAYLFSIDRRVKKIENQN